ncbi:hypothetical protein, partial [Desulfonatronospira sp.]
MYYKSSLKVLILALILLVGLYLQQSGIIDLSRELARAERLAELWWAPVVFILAMGSLYTIALPAAFFIWILGVIYHPWPATIMVIAGGVLG